MGKQKIFALYHGDEFIDVGTPKELAERQNIKLRTIYFYNSPTYKKNRCSNKSYVVVKVE